MEDYLTMNAKERERMRVLSKVKEGGMKLKEASELLSLGYCQCKRVWGQFLLEGDKGLIHRNRGKQSNHRKSRIGSHLQKSFNKMLTSGTIEPKGANMNTTIN